MTRFVALGDMDLREDGTRVNIEFLRSRLLDFDVMIILGDICYKWGDALDEMGEALEAIGAFRPIMVLPGNHEWDDRADQGFHSFNTRWHMPENGYLNQWYSWSMGDLHFVSLCTEDSLEPTSPQGRWLTNDLRRAYARGEFTIFMAHKVPLGSADKKWLNKKSALLREDLKHYFTNFRLPITLWGHLHLYERTQPIGACTYMTIGCGGARLDTEWHEPQPEWSAYRLADYGACFFQFDHNQRQLSMQYRTVHNGEAMDSFVMAENGSILASSSATMIQSPTPLIQSPLPSFHSLTTTTTSTSTTATPSHASTATMLYSPSPSPSISLTPTMTSATFDYLTITKSLPLVTIRYTAPTQEEEEEERKKAKKDAEHKEKELHHKDSSHLHTTRSAKATATAAIAAIATTTSEASASEEAPKPPSSTTTTTVAAAASLLHSMAIDPMKHETDASKDSPHRVAMVTTGAGEVNKDVMAPRRDGVRGLDQEALLVVPTATTEAEAHRKEAADHKESTDHSRENTTTTTNSNATSASAIMSMTAKSNESFLETSPHTLHTEGLLTTTSSSPPPPSFLVAVDSQHNNLGPTSLLQRSPTANLAHSTAGSSPNNTPAEKPKRLGLHSPTHNGDSSPHILVNNSDPQ